MTSIAPATGSGHGATSSRSGLAQAAAGLDRLLDPVIALALLVFLAPLMISLAVCIRLLDGGPALYGHARIGRNGRTFKCLKFRSMVVDADRKLDELLAADPAARSEWEKDRKLRRDPRITAIGAFLRKSSLDELPQLLNVIMGDMSLVGPRPIVSAEAERYGRYFNDYCSVRPGITGLWQVSGRNNLTYQQRVALDVLYARSRGPALYLKILVATFPAVLTRQGAS